MSELSDRINAKRQSVNDTRSLRRLEDDAAKLGHKINHSTISQYLKGNHGQPTAGIVSALADLFEIPVDSLRAAAGMRTIGSEPFTLDPEASLLNEEQREAVRGVVRAMLNQIPEAQNAPPRELQESRDELQARRDRSNPEPEQKTPRKIAAYEKGLGEIDPDAFEHET